MYEDIRNNKEIYFLIDGYKEEYRSIHSSHILKWALVKKYSSLGYKIFNLGEIHKDYQNKNGEPDNRFSDNKIIPICAYGQIAIVVKPKLKLMLMGSNQNNMEKFYKTLADYVM